MFPAIMTQNYALDRKCITLLKPRTMGNRNSSIQKALEEVHSEERARRVVEYLSECEMNKVTRCVARLADTTYTSPPSCQTQWLAQWFELAHSNDILCTWKRKTALSPALLATSSRLTPPRMYVQKLYFI